MTTLAQQSPSVLVDRHAAALDAALAALAGRSFFTRYPESPSPRVYGEHAAAEGRAACEAHLDAPYAALADQPSPPRVADDRDPERPPAPDAPPTSGA